MANPALRVSTSAVGESAPLAWLVARFAGCADRLEGVMLTGLAAAERKCDRLQQARH